MKYKGIFFTEPIESNALGHQMAEVYKDGIYYPYFQDKKDLTVIDCGANVGLTSFFFSHYAKIVYSIEPSSEHIEVLKYMLAQNEITNVKPFQFALSIKDDVGELTHYSNKTMYSLYQTLASLPGSVGNLQVTGKEPCKLKRIDTFFKEENIEHVDFMKLDCEGTEYEILGSDSFKNVAPKIDKILVEVHAYSGRHPNQIVESLKNNGYKVSQIPNDTLLLVGERTSQ
jgi:FkbM family methyltransferase